MATFMIRGMDERVIAELRVLAACRGVSMERHARDILERAVLGPAHDEPVVGVLPLPKRQPAQLARTRGNR
jgi:plasmid stability protein